MKVITSLQCNLRIINQHTQNPTTFLGMSLLLPGAGPVASHSMSTLKLGTLVPQMVVQEERGLPFQVGSAFYRRQSALARDLGVLLAAVHAQQNGGGLRVVDVMSGCGVRAARYLHQGGADFVWANDACGELAETLRGNLSQGGRGGEAEERWRITHEDANKLLLGCAVREDYFDLVDVDSFGSDSLCLGPALGAVKFGGLVYATCTDGFSSGGHRPHNSLASYGAFIGPMPFANEIGLRMLIGGAVREAATRNMNVVPVFSNYSYHGPVFRTMLRVQAGKPMINRNYGFIVYCKLCGESRDIQWENLGELACSCPHPKEPRSLIVSGPLWIGPLHNATDVKNMSALAKKWGWIRRTEMSRDSRKSDSTVDMNVLEELLEIMLDESQSGLPSGFLELGKISKRGKLQTPKRTEFMRVLQQGYKYYQQGLPKILNKGRWKVHLTFPPHVEFITCCLNSKATQRILYDEGVMANIPKDCSMVSTCHECSQKCDLDCNLT